MINELHRTYLLELLSNLGDAADGFVLAGAQSMRFTVHEARATRDFDFVLDVIALRGCNTPVAEILINIGYIPVKGSENFQFIK